MRADIPAIAVVLILVRVAPRAIPAPMLQPPNVVRPADIARIVRVEKPTIQVLMPALLNVARVIIVLTLVLQVQNQ